MPLENALAHSPTLVMVTGSGRSGTSTVAGALKMLGLHVPQPEVEANSSNPRGFFEPRWAVDLHKRLLTDAGVRTLDARPDAPDLLTEVVRSLDIRTELREWLSGQLEHDQIVVKDPRAFWLKDLWTGVAEELGLRTTFLTMLRHPAEVVGSRDMHYLNTADAEHRRARETANIAGWVNVALINERRSREDSRVFVHYVDLIEDWRSTMTTVGDRLELSYDGSVSASRPHEIDDFIDKSLRRSQLSWDDIHVPPDLREIAESVWSALDVLSRTPFDPAAQETLDEARERYQKLFAYAVAMTQDHTNYKVDVARRRARQRAARELRAQARTTSTPSTARRVVGKLRRLGGGG
jgi:hypothetical protein